MVFSFGVVWECVVAFHEASHTELAVASTAYLPIPRRPAAVKGEHARRANEHSTRKVIWTSFCFKDGRGWRA